MMKEQQPTLSSLLALYQQRYLILHMENSSSSKHVCQKEKLSHSKKKKEIISNVLVCYDK
jgi:hypothetical protein